MHAAVVGMWFAGLPPLTPVVNDVVELWQPLQSPVGGWFGSAAAVGRVTIVTPVKLFPVSWQLAHPDVIPVCTINVPGPNAVVDLWQVVQSAVVGM